MNARTLPAWPYPFWIAHRGAGRLAPENTLAAFRLGAQHGWRMFECDAKLSSDGVVFLLHDATLERTTDGAGSAGARPVPPLAGGGGFFRPTGCPRDIEISPAPGREAAIAAALAALAARLWQGAAAPPLLTSFQPAALAAAAQTAPQLPRGLLLDALRDGWLEQARQLGCVAVVCQHALWDAGTVGQVRAAGLRALSYTVNDEWAAERLIRLGTDGVVTDRVDLFSPA